MIHHFSQKKIGRLSLFALSLLVLFLIGCGKNKENYVLDLGSETETGSTKTTSETGGQTEISDDRDIFDSFAAGEVETLDTTIMQYKNYEDGLIPELLAQESQILLFFYSENDPASRALDKDIRTSYGTLPDKTVIIKIDQETQSNIYEKYNITESNMILFLNKEGEIARQIGLGITNLSMILKKL